MRETPNKRILYVEPSFFEIYLTLPNPRAFQLTWNVERLKLASVKMRLNAAAAIEIVRGGMHSPEKSKIIESMVNIEKIKTNIKYINIF